MSHVPSETALYSMLTVNASRLNVWGSRTIPRDGGSSAMYGMFV